MSTVVLLLIPIPIVGTVVRYRSTYYRKSTLGDAEIALPLTPALDDDDVVLAPGFPGAVDGTASEGPVRVEAGGPKKDAVELAIAEERTSAPQVQVSELTHPPTFSSVMKSVWREEKIEGTFKGIFPGLFFSLLFLRSYVSPGPSIYDQTPTWAFIRNLLYIPYLAATYRIIVSPHKVHIWAPKTIFRNTFSEYERQHPFRAIRHSPLVLPFLAVLCIDLFVVRGIRELLGDGSDLTEGFDPEDGIRWTEWVRLAWQHIVWREVARLVAYPVLMGLIAAAMAPVDVIVTRLAIQPVHGPAQMEPVGERDFEKTLAPPSYLHLTTEQKPYLGFVDCFQRVVKEEGWGVLYRSWFLTFVGYLHPALR